MNNKFIILEINNFTTLIDNGYIWEKFIVVIILDKKTSSKKAKQKIADLQAKKASTIEDFVGKVKKYGNGVTYQKNVRNEW